MLLIIKTFITECFFIQKAPQEIDENVLGINAHNTYICCKPHCQIMGKVFLQDIHSKEMITATWWEVLNYIKKPSRD